MGRDEFNEYIDMGPRHLQYNSPTFGEKLVEKLFPRHPAAKY